MEIIVKCIQFNYDEKREAGQKVFFMNYWFFMHTLV